MKIAYEPGDLIQRRDWYETEALKVVTVRENGLLVEAARPSPDYPAGPFFVPREQVEPMPATLRAAEWAVAPAQ